MRVIWSPTALRQVAQIFDYLMDFNPRAAEEVMAELLTTGDGLVNFPHRGRSLPNSDLRELVSTYPYIIRYRIRRNTVQILRIRHTSRRPVDL